MDLRYNDSFKEKALSLFESRVTLFKNTGSCVPSFNFFFQCNECFHHLQFSIAIEDDFSTVINSGLIRNNVIGIQNSLSCECSEVFHVVGYVFIGMGELEEPPLKKTTSILICAWKTESGYFDVIILPYHVKQLKVVFSKKIHWSENKEAYGNLVGDIFEVYP